VLQEHGLAACGTHGASIFFGPHQRIRTKHVPLHGMPLPEELVQQNHVMAKCREPIEWHHGLNDRLWEASRFKHAKKLPLNADLVKGEIRVTTLLTNVHACMNGNQVTSFFLCEPPNVEERLNFH
jgi:hypothetical protein